MKATAIASFILIALLLGSGIEFLIKLKKCEGKVMEDVRKPLTIRLNIIMILIALLTASVVAGIVFQK